MVKNVYTEKVLLFIWAGVKSVIGVFNLDLGWFECVCVWVRFSVCLSLSNPLSVYRNIVVCLWVILWSLWYLHSWEPPASIERCCKSFVMSLIMSEAFFLSASASVTICWAVWGPQCFSAWFSPLTALTSPDSALRASRFPDSGPLFFISISLFLPFSFSSFPCVCRHAH